MQNDMNDVIMIYHDDAQPVKQLIASCRVLLNNVKGNSLV